MSLITEYDAQTKTYNQRPAVDLREEIIAIGEMSDPLSQKLGALERVIGHYVIDSTLCLRLRVANNVIVVGGMEPEMVADINEKREAVIAAVEAKLTVANTLEAALQAQQPIRARLEAAISQGQTCLRYMTLSVLKTAFDLASERPMTQGILEHVIPILEKAEVVINKDLMQEAQDKPDSSLTD